MGDPLGASANIVNEHEVDREGHAVLDISSPLQNSDLGSGPEGNAPSKPGTTSSMPPLHRNFDGCRHSNEWLQEPLVATGETEPSNSACSVPDHVHRLSSDESMEQETMNPTTKMPFLRVGSSAPQETMDPCEQNHIFAMKGDLQREVELPEEGGETSQVPPRHVFETHRSESCSCQNIQVNPLLEECQKSEVTGSYTEDADTAKGVESVENCSSVSIQDLNKRHPSSGRADMQLNHQHSKSEQPEAKAYSLSELQSEWCAFKSTMEETKANLVFSGDSDMSEVQEKLRQLDEVNQETADIMSNILRRDEELYNLSLKLEKQAKMAPRSYYIQRITELTKNSWKQDTDIKQIMEDTRQLQLEINAVQESLNRTYALLDEIVFRDAKRDAAGRHTYRLLTSIHESFCQISDTILSIDRVKREASDYETRLGSLSSRHGCVSDFAPVNGDQQEA